MRNVRTRSFSGLYFPAFGLNIEIYGVFSIHIQSECGKIQTRKTPNIDIFTQWKLFVIYLSFSEDHTQTIFPKKKRRFKYLQLILLSNVSFQIDKIKWSNPWPSYLGKTPLKLKNIEIYLYFL